VGKVIIKEYGDNKSNEEEDPPTEQEKDSKDDEKEKPLGKNNKDNLKTTFSIKSFAGNCASNFSARSRGGIFACLANCMATLQAKSP
ncbi:MAG: hypothetical protein AAF304_09025, partial [Pseudomonadota bacterium]